MMYISKDFMIKMKRIKVNMNNFIVCCIVLRTKRKIEEELSKKNNIKICHCCHYQRKYFCVEEVAKVEPEKQDLYLTILRNYNLKPFTT